MKKPILLTAVLSVSMFCAQSLLGQAWDSGQSMLMFRALTNQAIAWTNIGQSRICAAQLRTLGSHARNYAYNNGHQMPSNWQDFTNDLSGPQFLYCPADLIHPVQSNWANVNFSAISYDIVSPGCLDTDVAKVFLRCSVHSNVVYVDGLTEEYRPYEDVPVRSTPNNLNWQLPPGIVARDKAVMIDCVSNLKQIGLAGEVWGSSHAFMPTSLSQMSNLLGTVNVLYCPADKTNVAPHTTNFASVNYASLDYTLASPGVSSAAYTNVFVRCRLHGSYALMDGSVVIGTNLTPPRVIVGHPLWQTVEPGASVTLSVLTGTDPSLQPFSFQWRRKQPIDAAGNPFTNTVLIAGATNSSLVFTNAQATNEGYYDVVVRDATGGYQESAVAYLRVEPLTSIRALSWQRLVCINNLKQMGTAARIGMDPSGNYPASISNMTAYLGWPAGIFCPSDSRTAPSSWSQVNFANTSYTWTSGLSDYDVTNVMAVCKVHGYVLLADGSVDAASFAAPQVNVQRTGGQAVVSWTNAGCSLQSASNVMGPYVDIVGASSPYTNSFATNQVYFRLRAN